MAKPRKEIVIGREYGSLTVLGPGEKDSVGHLRWNVRCRCGREYTVQTGRLSKKYSSCRGCALPSERKRLSFPGDIVNGFKILAEIGKNRCGAILYECRCLKCGAVLTHTRGDLTVRKGKGCRCCPPEYHFRIEGSVAYGTLPDGTEFTIDSELVDEVGKYNWLRNSKGYIQRSNRGLPKMMLHWFVMNLESATVFPVDHINRKKTDCRRENLRIVTALQNSMNHSRLSSNRSGYTGVFWNKNRRRWTSYIYAFGKHIYFGNFIDKESAAQCYNYACELLRGEYAGERNEVPDASDELKLRVYQKCLPYMNTEVIVAMKAAFLLKEACNV